MYPTLLNVPQYNCCLVFIAIQEEELIIFRDKKLGSVLFNCEPVSFVAWLAVIHEISTVNESLNMRRISIKI